MHAHGRRIAGADAAGAPRADQIRELVRLSNTLRADLGLKEVLAQLASTVGGATGFNLAVFNLVEEGQEHLRVAAVAGLTAAEAQQLTETPPRLQAVLRVMREEFRLSHSYFISHEHPHALDAVDTITPARAAATGGLKGNQTWHPEDTLLVPLVSARHDRLLGILSLDQPMDGRVPTPESMELVELFANQAASAIDMATLFEEREREQRALQAGIYRLLAHLGLIGQGQLAERVELGDTLLQPVGDSLNATVEYLRAALARVYQTSEAATQLAEHLRTAVGELVVGAHGQTQQVERAVEATETLEGASRRAAASADQVMRVALEASAIAHEGRDAAEGAAIGMVRVRERTLQAARKIKHLGEMTQQISEIVQTVAQFADETQVLALNAAIEAARAGDQGRGFTLVAQQIRDLATNSSEAARAITGRIKALQQETSAIAVTIEESTRDVVEQSDLAAVAGAALGAADGVGQRMMAGMSDVSQMTAQQMQAAAQVSRALDELSRVVAHTQERAAYLHLSMEQLTESARAAQLGAGAFRLERSTHGEELAPDAAGASSGEVGASPLSQPGAGAS